MVRHLRGEARFAGSAVENNPDVAFQPIGFMHRYIFCPDVFVSLLVFFLSLTL
jgi:hypothetical protein